jgi:hypothetical protein
MEFISGISNYIDNHLYAALIAAILYYALTYLIHVFAARNAIRLVDSEDPIFDKFSARGLAIGLTVIILLLLGLKNPDILINISKIKIWEMFYLSVAFKLPALGWVFWVVLAAAVLLMGISLWIICAYHDNYTISSYAYKIFRVLLCGILDLPWCMTVISLSWAACKSIVTFIVFIAIATVFSELCDKAVIRTWHVYSNKRGYLGDVYTIEYKDDDDKSKK